MESRTNRRGYLEHFVRGQHLKLDELKKIAPEKRYISKQNIPAYPRPEFHVSALKHDTDGAGLRGIRRDGGFKFPGEDSDGLVWWSLAVAPDEIQSAERKLLNDTYPDRAENQAQTSFLEKFTSSPAFSGPTSRLGSYRFTFPLDEVLKVYSEKFCSKEPPVMRVFETVLYKQEVVHVVLVHSPANQEQFSEFPPLTDDQKSICSFKDGRFIWRPEAICETHRFELVQRPDEMQMEAQEVDNPQFYVWDNVAVALHVGKEVLKFDVGVGDQLRENLTFCSEAQIVFTDRAAFDDFSKAEKEVKSLWPDYPFPLERS